MVSRMSKRVSKHSESVKRFKRFCNRRRNKTFDSDTDEDYPKSPVLETRVGIPKKPEHFDDSESDMFDVVYKDKSENQADEVDEGREEESPIPSQVQDGEHDDNDKTKFHT